MRSRRGLDKPALVAPPPARAALARGCAATACALALREAASVAAATAPPAESQISSRREKPSRSRMFAPVLSAAIMPNRARIEKPVIEQGRRAPCQRLVLKCARLFDS